MYRLTLTGVSKTYFDKKILTGIDMAVREGEFIVLLGPSGCGKTTLLRIIAGLESVTSGSIQIDQEVVNLLPPRVRDVAMVFQNYSLYLHKTVAANLAFALKMRKMPSSIIRKRVAQIAALLRLEHLLKRYPGHLSGGEKQRVAIGRALVRQPRLYLFDEPLSNLDAALRLELRTEIKRIHQKFNTTSIYVTHDQVEAMGMADRLVVLNDGKIIQMGSPYEIYQKPRNRFVAGFLGNPGMNFFAGDLDQTNGSIRFRTKSLQVPMLVNAERFQEKDMILGIRPEHMGLTSHKGYWSFDSRVILVENLGLEQQIVLENDDGLFRIRANQQARVTPGENVSVYFHPDDFHWFSKTSGDAIFWDLLN